jgi:hypothetical protein
MLNVDTTKSSKSTRTRKQSTNVDAEVVSKSRAKSKKAADVVNAKVDAIVRESFTTHAKRQTRARNAAAKKKEKVVAILVNGGETSNAGTTSSKRVTRTIGEHSAMFRASGKRLAIIDAWLINNRITLDEVAEITGWAKGVNSSELFQIAAIFKCKIARNGVGEYSFDI